MRMYHSLYITDLLSVIDIIHERPVKGFKEHLEDTLKTPELSGVDVLGYLRELRNGIVHRGIDPTAGGEVISGARRGVTRTIAKLLRRRSAPLGDCSQSPAGQ